MNKAVLAGTVVNDPKISITTTGKKVANLRISTLEGKKTDYHSIVAWEGLATYVQDNVAQGSTIYVEGPIRTRSYEAKDGSGKRYVTEIVATRLDAVAIEDPTVEGF